MLVNRIIDAWKNRQDGSADHLDEVYLDAVVGGPRPIRRENITHKPPELLTAQAAEPAASTAPIFILCAARTGSTLLRVLLDTHKQVACPPETHMVRVCESMERTWRMISQEGGLRDLPSEVVTRIGNIAAEPLDAYARARGKSRWCDKSLDNAMLSPMLAQIYPDAQFICLFRHCLDFVMSGLEASCWGFGGYGFDEYARRYPENSVQALITYWCDHVEPMLAIREACANRTISVRYEEIVREPGATMERIVSFLGLASQPGLEEDAFSGRHDFGAGDHKIAFTGRVDPGSIGTGRRIPVSVIPADLRRRMNAALEQIGYPEVDDDWNYEASSRPRHSRADDDWAILAARRVLRGVVPPECAHDEQNKADLVQIVLDDLGVQWTISLKSGAVRRCEEGCATDGRLLINSIDLRRLITGELNVGSALRTGVLRAKGGISIVGLVVEALRARFPVEVEY